VNNVIHNRIKNNRFLKEYIDNYENNNGISIKTKISILIYLYIGLLMSGYFINNIYLRLLLVVVGIGVSIHIISLKTKN
jgi:uncharacterized membrane protein YbaN (DUF454 family)